MKKFTIVETIKLVQGIQHRNHRAYISHRKRRILELEGFKQLSL